MSHVIDPPIVVDGVEIRAISKLSIGSSQLLGGSLFWGRKRPVAFLMCSGSNFDIFDMSGRNIEPSDVDIDPETLSSLVNGKLS